MTMGMTMQVFKNQVPKKLDDTLKTNKQDNLEKTASHEDPADAFENNNNKIKVKPFITNNVATTAN